eukprot:m.315293 g.315293  ORF g.315293 m.315293 type:complete len:369 (+) comp19674_c2_seq9:1183-2289(+)
MDVFSDLVLDAMTQEPRELCLLGRKYELDKEGDGRARFFRDMSRFLWFTYRRGFAPIGNTAHQTDSGWGCMLRCGQMLLAQAMLASELGDDWLSHKDLVKTRRRIVNYFLDDPRHPYSIHNIAVRGSIVKKSIGDWFGPNAMAQVLKSLTAEQPECGLTVHVAMDSCVCTETVVNLCSREDGSWRPLLLLIPLRLGLDKLNEVYLPELKRIFTLPGTLGAIGGRPNSAYYFVGTQGDDTVYLDPHTTQLAVSLEDESSFSTYSCREPQWTAMDSLDPSLCLAFLCRSRKDFHVFVSNFTDKPAKHQLFTIIDREPSFDIAFADGADFVLSDDDDDGLGGGDGAQGGLEDSDEGFEIVPMPGAAPIQHL